MSTILGNTPSEMLHLFVDGELNNSQEHILFSQLADSEELQLEMKELLSIRESVQNDVEAFTPPAGATRGVFSRLGFTAPTKQPIPVPLPYTGGAISNFVRKAWLPVAAALVASLGTFMLLQNNDATEVSKVNSNIPVTRAIDNDDFLAASGNTVRNSLSDGAKNISQLGSIDNIKSTNVYSGQKGKNSAFDQSYMTPANFAVQITPIRNKYSDNDELLSSNSNDHAILNYAAPTNSARLSKTISQEFPGYNPGIGEYHTLSNLTQSENRGLSLVVRGIHAESYPGSNLPSKAYPIFSNMSVAMQYQLNDNFLIGAEFGQEPFGQILKTPTDITYQNPMVFWGAASLKYQAGQQIFNLAGAEPFAQVLLGGTEMGPLVKGIIGLQFISKDWGFGMNFGIEGTSLLYNFNDDLYRTDKLGLTYGIIYSF